MVPLLTSGPNASFSEEPDALRRLACQYFGRAEFDMGVRMKLKRWLIRQGHVQRKIIRNERMGFSMRLRAREMAVRLQVVKVLALLEQEIRSNGGVPVATAPAARSFETRAIPPTESHKPIPLDEAELDLRWDVATEGEHLSEIPAIDSLPESDRRRIDSDSEEIQRAPFALERELRSDPMPEPSGMTLGVLAHLVWEIERGHGSAGCPSRDLSDFRYTPGLRRWIERRQQVIYSAPGYSEFMIYLNAELGMALIPNAISEVERRLAQRLRKTFEEVRRLSLVEVMTILNQPEAPAIGSSTGEHDQAGDAEKATHSPIPPPPPPPDPTTDETALVSTTRSGPFRAALTVTGTRSTSG
jgi:hypothetical protein